MRENEVGQVMNLIVDGPRAAGPEGLAAADDAKRLRKLRRLVRQENVVALGVAEKLVQGKGTGTVALTFYVVDKRRPEQVTDAELVPTSIPAFSGRQPAIATDVVRMGTLRPEPNVTHSPIEPGYSVGNPTGETGTVGAIVTHSDRYFILSNSHVLAREGRARKGDTILYPGVDDGGKAPRDALGALVEFTRLKKGSMNDVDCAIAEIAANRLGEVVAKIKGIGFPLGVTSAKVGMRVVKVGRTTGKTSGRIISTSFRPLKLTYPETGVIGFTQQILVSRLTRPGDSGSLIIDQASGKAVGLHFAGADGGSVCTPIDRVLSSMNVCLVTSNVGG